MKLLLSALVKFISGVLLVGILVFLPAGTLNFSGGILFMTALFLPMLLLGVLLL